MKNIIVISGLAILACSSAWAAPLTLGKISPQNLNLGVKKMITLQLTASDEFKGNKVALVLDRSQLDSLDKSQDIAVQVDPAEVDLKAGQSVSITLAFAVSTAAPDFTDGLVHLTAREVKEADPEVATSDISLTVKSILEIALFGGPAPEKWSTSQKISVRRHNGGVTVHFVNFDRENGHVIHGQGAIQHGPVSDPMDPSQTDGQPGGFYEFKMTSTQKNYGGIYYCHEHEDSDIARSVVFNADL